MRWVWVVLVCVVCEAAWAGGCGCGPNGAPSAAAPYMGSLATSGEVWEASAYFSALQREVMLVDVAAAVPTPDSAVLSLDMDRVKRAWLSASDTPGRTTASAFTAASTAPDRFSVWAAIDPADPGLRVVMDDAVSRGVEGFVLNGMLDSARWEAVFALCDAYALPVRVEADWHVPGALCGLDTLLSAHPNMRVIASGWLTVDGRTGAARALLDAYPNLYIDTAFAVDAEAALVSACGATAGFQSLAMGYPDRVLFASGSRPDMRRTTIDFLTRTRFISPLLPDRQLEGLSLPPPVLARLFSENARRFMLARPSGTRPGAVDRAELENPSW